MQKTAKKKIVLNSQTVRNLRPEKLEGVQGGIPVTTSVAPYCNPRACA